MGSRDDMRMSVVLLGLLASLGWGVADFGGGLTSRRGPVLGVLLWSQVASLAVGLPIALSRTEPVMQPLDLAICVAGGALGSSGLALLYRGLSVGRMGVVAPVAAVLTAVLPVSFGFLTQGIPSILSIGGIGCAVVSVILVSRAPGAADGRPSGLWYGIGAGTVFGLFTIAVSLLGDGLILSPIIVIRIASCLGDRVVDPRAARAVARRAAALAGARGGRRHRHGGDRRVPHRDRHRAARHRGDHRLALSRW